MFGPARIFGYTIADHKSHPWNDYRNLEFTLYRVFEAFSHTSKVSFFTGIENDMVVLENVEMLSTRNILDFYINYMDTLYRSTV